MAEETPEQAAEEVAASESIPAVASGDLADMSAAIAGLGAAERLAALGAALIAANYLFFEVIVEEYFFATSLLVVASLALLAVWVRSSKDGADWPIPYGWAMKVLGFAAGVYGLVELITDLRRGVLEGFMTILGALVLYAGVVLMVMGARQISTRP